MWSSWLVNWIRLACAWRLLLFGAGRSPAPVASFASWLVEELEERVPGFDESLKLHVAGCPNACGQHWIADIGLEGKKIKEDGALVDAYYFCLGGAVGQHQQIARQVGFRCSSREVPNAIERLLRSYLAGRDANEN